MDLGRQGVGGVCSGSPALMPWYKQALRTPIHQRVIVALGDPLRANPSASWPDLARVQYKVATLQSRLQPTLVVFALYRQNSGLIYTYVNQK